MVADPDSVAMLQAAKSQATAAWVQAAGALVAMALSLFLWWSDRRSRQRVAAARARTAALTLLPPFTEHHELLEWAHNQLLRWNRPAHAIGMEGPGMVVALWDVPPYPKRLSDVQGTLADLDSAAAPVQRAFLALQRMETERRVVQEGWEWEPDEDRGYTAEQVKTATDLLVEAVILMDAALNAMGELFDR